MSKKIYDYDIGFTLKEPMIMAVAATSAKQAKLTALRQLESMPKEEILDRFLSALNINPDFNVEFVDCIEETSYCFNEEEKEKLIQEEKELNKDYE